MCNLMDCLQNGDKSRDLIFISSQSVNSCTILKKNTIKHQQQQNINTEDFS